MLRSIFRLTLIAALTTLIAAYSARGLGAGIGRSTLQWDYETLTGAINTVLVDAPYRHEFLSRPLHLLRDGQFAWVENGVLRLWNGASLEHIPLSDTPMSDLAWSSDGRVAWITRSTPDSTPNLHLWDGHQAVQVGSSADSITPPVWSKDGRLAWIAIQGDDVPSDIYVWDGHNAILIESQMRAIDSPTWSNAGHLAWSATGVGGEALDIFVWDGASVTNLSESVDSDVLPVWSQDGRLIWQTYSHATWFSFSYWDGEAVRNNVDGHVFVGSEPAWSSTGRLAYAAVLPEFGGTKIMVWDGERVLNLTPSTVRNMSPRWSPDGSRLAWAEGDHISIWNGSSILTVPLAVDAYIYMPTPSFFWSPE